MERARQAFVGTYTGMLAWEVEHVSELTQTPVELEDHVQLTIERPGQASLECSNQLRVPVSVTLSSSASGLKESGEATLFIPPSSGGLVAQLNYENSRIVLSVTLPEVAAGRSPSGFLDALDETLPGNSAQFIEEP